MADELNFRETIAKLLKKTGLSMAKVAREAGINHQTMYHYMSGKTDIKSENLSKILNVLKQHKAKQKAETNPS